MQNKPSKYVKDYFANLVFLLYYNKWVIKYLIKYCFNEFDWMSSCLAVVILN